MTVQNKNYRFPISGQQNIYHFGLKFYYFYLLRSQGDEVKNCTNTVICVQQKYKHLRKLSASNFSSGSAVLYLITNQVLQLICKRLYLGEKNFIQLLAVAAEPTRWQMSNTFSTFLFRRVARSRHRDLVNIIGNSTHTTIIAPKSVKCNMIAN